MRFPISESKDSFDEFTSDIYQMLSQINLNILVLHEYDLRFRLAKLIQEAIESNSKENKIILTLERQSKEKKVKIDMVLYYLHQGKPYSAEIIELKRGISDTYGKKPLSDLQLKKHFYEEPKGSYAIDLKKLVKRVSTKEGIGQGYSYLKGIDTPNIPIQAGFFINLCPIKKIETKNDPKWSTRLTRREAIPKGVMFWNNPLGKDVVRKNIQGEKVHLTHYKPDNYLRVDGQKIAEYLDIIMVKRVK